MYSGRYGDVARRRLEVEYMSFIKDPSPCRYQSSTVIRSSNVVGVKITQKPTLKAFCGQLLLFGNKQSEVDDGRRSLAGLHSTPPPPRPRVGYARQGGCAECLQAMRLCSSEVRRRGVTFNRHLLRQLAAPGSASVRRCSQLSNPLL